MRVRVRVRVRVWVWVRVRVRVRVRYIRVGVRYIRINPGHDTQEDNRVVGFGRRLTPEEVSPLASPEPQP